MREQIIAKAYAQSILELSKDQGTDVATEMTKFNEVINKNNDLENVFFLDVFTPEEKMAVASDIISKLNLSKLFNNFFMFLIQEKRLPIFPLIFKEVIVIDDHNKGFLRGTIEGSGSEVSADFKEKMKAYLEKKLGQKCDLDYKQNDKITAGYRVTVEDLQLDASLDNQLDKLKNSIINA